MDGKERQGTNSTPFSHNLAKAVLLIWFREPHILLMGKF